jgi:hypothetical protein
MDVVMDFALTETRRMRLPGRRFVPWTVPAWLPREVEGPLTFIAGVVGGLLLAFFFATVWDVLAPFGGEPRTPSEPSEPGSHAAAVLEPGARVLIITKPVSFAERAAVAAAVEVPPAAARAAAPHPIGPRTVSHKTAIARPLAKRDALLDAPLTP